MYDKRITLVEDNLHLPGCLTELRKPRSSRSLKVRLWI